MRQATPFSVIIATCNRPDRLLRAVRAAEAAIRAYGDPGCEVVVADNGRVRPAADAIRDYAREASVPVRTVASEPNSKAAALNAGIAAAANRWLAFTDDDCLPDPGWLIGGAGYIERFASVKVFSGRLCAGPVDFPLPRWLPPGSGPELPWSPAFVDFAPLPESGVIPEGDRLPFGANIFVHKGIYEQYGGYDEALWRRCGKAALGSEDAEFALRVRNAGEPIGYCHEALVVHPVYPERTTLTYYLRHIFHSGVREPFFTEPDRRASTFYLVRTLVAAAARSGGAWLRGDPVGCMRHFMNACRDAGEIWGWRRVAR